MASMGFDPITGIALGSAVVGLATSIFGSQKDKDNVAAQLQAQRLQVAADTTASAQRTQLVVTVLVGTGVLLVGGMLLYGAVKGRK